MDAIETKTRGLLAGVLAGDTAMAYLSAKATSAGVTAGMLVLNPSMTDDKGNVATKLTEFGYNYLQSPEGTDPATVGGDKTQPYTPAVTGTATGDGAGAPAETLKPNTASTLSGASGRGFARVAITLPKLDRGARKSDYPTDKLVAPFVDGGVTYNDGYFLPPTPESPDPAKAYSAVASAANKRWKDGNGGQPKRRFTSRVMDGAPFGQPGVKGVGVFRTE